MTQSINSYKASASGTKSKDTYNLYPFLEYDRESTRNSVGLVNPVVMESFLKDTRVAFEQSNKKTSRIITKNSSKSSDIRTNAELECGFIPNRPQNIKNVIFNIEERKIPHYLLVDEKPSTSTETPNKSNSIIVSDKLISKKNLSPRYNKRTSDPNVNEILPTRVLRSAGKYAEFKRELKSASDFNIENVDWYYEDENYYKRKLQVTLSDFAIPTDNRREGNSKLSYNYLLLDSRKCRSKAHISWLDFIEAIFYIGKGKNDRAFEHAKEAEKYLTPDNKKCLKIKEIWDRGYPIKVFLVTENIIAEEAYTREAAMIEAMSLKRLCNRKNGSYYGIADTMKARERLELGTTLLIEARDIFRLKKVFDIYPKNTIDIVSFARLQEITTSIDSKESPKNEEPKNGAITNKGKRTNIILHGEEKEQSGFLPVEFKIKTSTETFNKIKEPINNKFTPKKVITYSKAETDKTEKTRLDTKDTIAKTTLNAKKKELLPAFCNFSIENIDWYYNDENYYKNKLHILLSDFAIPKKNRREGNEKLYYNFLLLDSRRCREKTNIGWIDFVKAIFYIGKGKSDRAVKLVKETERVSNKTSNKQLFLKIKDIWNSGNTVKVCLVTESIIAEEAYTRSAAMIDAMSLNKLCNERRGSYYEKFKAMNDSECFELGVTLLMEARDKFRWKKTIDVYPKK